MSGTFWFRRVGGFPCLHPCLFAPILFSLHSRTKGVHTVNTDMPAVAEVFRFWKLAVVAGVKCSLSLVFPFGTTSFRPDWKVCIAQPRSRLRNFGPSARPGAQILEIFFSGAQFTKARMQNAIAQFLKRVERAEMVHRTGNTQ